MWELMVADIFTHFIDMNEAIIYYEKKMWVEIAVDVGWLIQAYKIKLFTTGFVSLRNDIKWMGITSAISNVYASDVIML